MTRDEREDQSLPFSLPLVLDERPGPARAISSRRAASLIEAALLAAGGEAAAGGGADGSAAEAGADVAAEPKRARRWRTVGWQTRWQVAAAVVLLVLGVAVAAVYRWQGRPAGAGAAVPMAVSPAAPEASKLPASPVVPELPAPPSSAAIPAKAAVRAQVKGHGAEDLLRLANEHRRARRWAEADEVYQRVMKRYRGTAAAQVAQLASAALHLEHLGQPQEALRLYRGAVRGRTRGPMAEEAQYGVAEACRALGDVAGEAQALRGYLRLPASADSPMRQRAQARLSALGAK